MLSSSFVWKENALRPQAAPLVKVGVLAPTERVPLVPPDAGGRGPVLLLPRVGWGRGSQGLPSSVPCTLEPSRLATMRRKA